MKRVLVYSSIVLFAFFISEILQVNTAEGKENIRKMTAVKDTADTKSSQEIPDWWKIKELKLSPINKKLVDEGKSIFNSKCTPCHNLDSKLVGPPLRKIAKQQTPLFLINYLMNTKEMQQKEPQLKELIKQFNNVIMPDQGLKEKESRSIVEYFRSLAK
jgi:cytochrome c2